MSRPEHRADEPDDATTELPNVPHAGPGADPLDPASLAWSTDTDAPASDPAGGAGGPRLAGAPASELSDVSFPTAWRGYEPTAVDAYVRQVTRTIADLEGNRSPAEAVKRALDRVGEETSSILHEAEQTAERMTERSRTQSSERLEQAEREADEITLSARTRLRSLDADVDRIWLERQRLIDDTRRLAERLLEIADQAEERFPAEEEDTASEDTTVRDSVRAPRGAGDTLRFAPPGVIEPEPDPFATDAAAGVTGEEHSVFGADRPDAQADASEHDPATEVERGSDEAPAEASLWSTPPLPPEPDAEGHSEHGGDHADDGGDAIGSALPEPGEDQNDEPLISWSTPEPEHEPPPDDRPHEGAGHEPGS